MLGVRGRCSSCAVSSGLELGDAVLQTDLQFAIDERQQAICVPSGNSFCDSDVSFGLRAARQHRDEFAIFELRQDVHFAK